MLSKVLRPMISGLPIVIRLKWAKSPGSRHGIWLPLPMTPLLATAAMMRDGDAHAAAPSFSSATPVTRQRRQSSRNTAPCET